MNIIFSEKAIGQLESEEVFAFQLNPGFGGCSIGSDWISFVVLSSHKKEEDGEKILTTNFKPVILGSDHKIFFDSEMTIDYSVKRNTFILKSKNGILNPFMKLEYN